MRALPVIGFFLFVALLMAMLLGQSASQSAAGEGPHLLPPMTVTALNGKTKWNQASLQGRVTVLNFFASWCVPCAVEMPEMAALAKDFPALHIEGVAWNDEPATLTVWLKKHGNPFRAVWLDTDGDATIALGLKGVPETLVIDARGMIRYRIMGPLTSAERAAALDPLLHQLLDEARHAP